MAKFEMPITHTVYEQNMMRERAITTPITEILKKPNMLKSEMECMENLVEDLKEKSGKAKDAKKREILDVQTQILRKMLTSFDLV